MQKLASPVKPHFTEGSFLSIDLFRCGRQFPHYHENTMEIILCLQGKITVYSMHEQHCLGPGDLIQADMFDIHSISSEEDSIVASFHIDLEHPVFAGQGYQLLYYVCSSDSASPAQQGQLLHLRLLLLSLLSRHLQEPENPDISQMALRLMKILREHFQYYDRINIHAEMYPQEMKDRFERIMAYLLDHYAERITLRTLCDMEHISYNYLSRFFKDSSLKTFRNFLHEIRIYHSEHLLLCQPELSIRDVSYQVGFADPKLFYREFRKKHGHTPHQHRIWYRRYNEKITPDIPLAAKDDPADIDSCLNRLFADAVMDSFDR